MIEVSALQKYSLFGGLDADQIGRIRPFMEQESYNTGDDIIVEGTPNDRIRFILDGRVEIVKNGMLLAELTEGATVGEMEVLDMQPAAATVRALCPVEVTTLSNASLHEIYKRDIKAFSLIVMNLARDLARRLHRADEMSTGSGGQFYHQADSSA
jgi:CRP-like cAMP-binding protein